jgi:hypothetical protein
MELPLVADLSRWQPDGGQAVEVEELGQALGVELIGLIDVAHHELGLGGVGQEGDTACSFDLVGDPVPIADALKSHWGLVREVFQEGPDGAGLMVEPVLDEEAPVLIQDGELRVVLVSVTTDPIIHGICTFLCLRARRKTNCDEDSGRCPTGAKRGSAFILSTR